jgi:hypothetical protein
MLCSGDVRSAGWRLMSLAVCVSLIMLGIPVLALDNDPPPDPDGQELVYYATTAIGNLTIRSSLPAPDGTDLSGVFVASNGQKIKVTSNQRTVNVQLPVGQITTQALADSSMSVTLRANGQQVTFRCDKNGNVLDPIDQNLYTSIRLAILNGSGGTLGSAVQFGVQQELLVQDANGNYVPNPDAATLSGDGCVPDGIGTVIWKVMVCVAAIIGWIGSVVGLVGCATVIACVGVLILFYAANLGVISACGHDFA